MEGLTEKLLAEWLLSDTDSDLPDVNNRVTYLERKLYDDYEPSQFRQFRQRLDWWLANVEQDDQRKTLYKLLGSLFFVGREEFESLCRAAFNGPVRRWLIDGLDLDFFDKNAGSNLKSAIRNTWFCPVTDSMRINAFLKVNNLEGHRHRPDWRSLAKFSDAEKIQSFVKKEGIERLVLLEDFVGSGTQMSSAVSYASKVLDAIPVMCCPLIVCPDGVSKGEELQSQFTNLKFEPVLSLPKESFIKFETQRFDTVDFIAVRELTASVADRLIETSGASTHGFEGTGALVVLYSNCPNNTLPIVHDHTDTWHPLFPRIRRR